MKVLDNPIPVGRISPALTIFDGKHCIYLIGGHRYSWYHDGVVRVFNITSNTWFTLGSVGNDIGTTGFDTYFDSAYFVNHHLNYYTHIYQYNLTSNSINTPTATQMPHAVIYPCVVVLESQHKVLVIAGDGRAYPERANKTRIFDIPTLSWTTGQDTKAYGNGWCTSVNDIVYKFGGTNPKSTINHGKIEKVDMNASQGTNLEAREWMIINATLTIPRYGGGGNQVVHGIDNKVLYLLGGYQHTADSQLQGMRSNVDVFDIETEIISAGIPLPEPAYGMGTIQVFGTIYAFGMLCTLV